MLNNRNKLGILVALLLMVSLLVAGCVSQPSEDKSVKSNSTPSEISKAPNTTMISENKTGQDKVNESIMAAIADGVYAEQVTYSRPNGQEEVKMSITLEGGVVTAASISAENPNEISKKFIEGVNASLPSLVFGKKIEEINLPKQVAGSSLTSAAFANYAKQVADGKVPVAG